jgi:asparagine synthase (glutamine-hydrolysing)
MCGIAGIFSKSGVEHEIVGKMVSRLVHRGPDADGYWGSDLYKAGMRRLSILDCEGGNQPLFDESGQVVLFYNGEIYNSPSIRDELERDGVRFRTNSDGEVICHLYRKYGRGMFARLDGMFAVALWDKQNETLLLARDFPGEKPLYFSELANGGIAFSSEIPSLLASGQVSREIDTQSLWDYPSFLWVPEPATIYKSIRAIMPGEGLEISSKGKIAFEFKTEIATPNLPFQSDADAVASVREIVGQAAHSRLLSDVPVGAFLSGGLDSSIVCKLASEKLEELSTFCIGFEDVVDPYHGYSDESLLAEGYANQLGTRHTTIRVTASDFRELLPQFLSAAGQPYAVSSGLGILAIARVAQSKGVKVLLSGDGADEAFGGYSWYSKIPGSFSGQSANGVISRYLDGDESDSKRLRRMAGYKPQLRAWAWHYYASEEEKKLLFHRDVESRTSLRIFDEHKFEEPLDYLRHDRMFYFPNEMLSKVDRMTMAFSVEGRAPFAAPSVQKFAAQLPWEQLVRNGQLKWVLRQAFSTELPSGLVSRAKHGFNVPIDHWLKGEWSDLMDETFSDASPLSKLGLLSPNAYKHARNILHDPAKIAGHVLFSFVMLHLWMKENEN